MPPPASGGPYRRSARPWIGDLWRLGALVGFALWLTHPFFTSRLIGSGDAWWYGNMLRDFLAQLRQGVFPVWTGQTEFAYNGAVYPLRAAPYYQYLGGLLDLLTGRRLDAFTIQHGTVIVSFLAAAGITYGALCRLAPDRRNIAALLTALYLACPAVLGLATSMDLYMSVMALPYLPLVTCGLALCLQEGGPVAQELVKSDGGLASPKLQKCEGGLATPEFQRNEGGWRSQRMIVIGLAATWYAHAPLAAWLTLITIVVQAVRIGRQWRNRQVWIETIGSGLLLAALVAYVFVSVASLRGGDHANLVPYPIERVKIVAAVDSAFPGCLLPVHAPAVNLGDPQLGYALWTVLLSGIAFTALPGARRHLALSVPALFIVVLLLPIPGVTPWLWQHVPESLARLTNDWPMHRLVPLLAALSLPLGMLALFPWEVPNDKDQVTRSLPHFLTPTSSPSPAPSLSPPLSLIFSSPYSLILFLTALAWAVYQANEFVDTAAVRTASAQDTAIKRRPENVPLMNHSYGLSLKLPPYFSNGVMDPWFELRVLEGGKVVLDNASARMANKESPWADLTTQSDPNPGVWDLAPNLTLMPGLHYLLEFDFDGRTYTGTLQFEGGHFFRQYRLPESGEPQAFGSESSSAHWIPLWTSEDHPEVIRVRFIPDPDTEPSRPPIFARFRCLTTDTRTLPLRIDSYAPLRLTATLAQPGLLETSRMYFPGYRVKIDGHPVPVVPSPSRLVAVPLPAGIHSVEIDYRPPLNLVLALAISAATWLALPACALWRSSRNYRAAERRGSGAA